MKIQVRLFGTLSKRYPGYDPAEGLEVELTDRARVGDLLARLGLGEGNKAVVSVDSVIRGPQDGLYEGAVVHVLQAVYGG